MVRVLLVDSSPEVRGQVRAALVDRGGFKVVGEADTGLDAVEQVAAVRPDVVIVDLGLPDLAGREVLSRMHARSPKTKVVVLSGGGALDRPPADSVTEGAVAGDTLAYLVSLVGSLATPRTTAPALHLPDDPRRVGEARRFVRRQLAEWGEDELIDDASLIVTELAANAVDHAHGDYQVRTSLGTTSVRIEVIDRAIGTTPEPRPPSDNGERGRGLLIVDSLAASWGIEDLGDRKVVWADLLRNG